MNVASQYVSVCILNLLRHFLHCPTELLTPCSFGLAQGGGLYIVGTATLTDTNVYSNTAETVCSPTALSLRIAPSLPTALS